MDVQKLAVFDKRQAVEKLERFGFLDESNGYGDSFGIVHQALKQRTIDPQGQFVKAAAHSIPC